MQRFVPELISRKRDGEQLKPEEVTWLIDSYTRGDIPDYQMSALLMAIVFQGLDDTELHAWSEAMLHSGEILDLSSIEARKVDKHSTGGVGDKISLCLAPAVAACGVPVPMISGRGLGHTGGTLDKLESIPGFRIDIPTDEAISVLGKTGLFLIGQTADLAPADRKLYRLRDVTGTVESIPLIASSIMSKKLAEGIDGLVLDVKVGKGAFMPTIEQARQLASTICKIGEGAGKEVRALITNMNAPIGHAVGNALEVAEALEVLAGEGPPDTTTLTVELGAEMLLLGKVAGDIDDGRQQIEDALSSGRAMEKFREIIAAQGGDPRVCEDISVLPTAKEMAVVPATDTGFVSEIHPRKVAIAALEVGAGRRTKEDDIDPATGVTLLVEHGASVEEGEPLAILHHNGVGEEVARGILAGSFTISETQPPREKLILERN